MKSADRTHRTLMWARALIALFCAINYFPLPSTAEITVEGDTVVVRNGHDQKDCVERVKRIVPFEKRLRLDRFPPSIPHSLLFNMKSSMIQGVKVAVSPGKGFAVIMSYVRSKPLLAAEVPYDCDSSIAVIDSAGCVRSRLKGDYLWIVPHESLPCFALVQDYCCDIKGKATLFGLSGNKICDGYIGRETPVLTGNKFTCGTEWRRGKLDDRKDVLLNQVP